MSMQTAGIPLDGTHRAQTNTTVNFFFSEHVFLSPWSNYTDTDAGIIMWRIVFILYHPQERSSILLWRLFKHHTVSVLSSKRMVCKLDAKRTALVKLG
jgi:hypothetical protein